MAGTKAMLRADTSSGGGEIEEGVEPGAIQIGLRGGGGQPAVNDAAQHGAGQILQRGEGEAAARIDAGGALGPDIQRGVILLQQLTRKRESGQRIPALVGGGAPGGDDFLADTIAEKSGGFVGSVFAPACAGSSQGGEKSGLVEIQQGSKMRAPQRGLGMHRTRSRQTGRAGAAPETHQDGLGDIVAVMSGAERGDAAATQRCGEKLDTRGTRLGLGGGGRIARCLIPATRDQIDAQGAAERDAETRVGDGGAAAQTMIKMQGDQACAASGEMRPKQKQQRDRIGPAGEGDGKAFARRTGVDPDTNTGMQPVAGNSCGEAPGDPSPPCFFNHGYHG